MRWKSKYPNEWRRWFAWKPVQLDFMTDCTYVWLEFVNTKTDSGMEWYSDKKLEELQEYYR